MLRVRNLEKVEVMKYENILIQKNFTIKKIEMDPINTFL